MRLLAGARIEDVAIHQQQLGIAWMTRLLGHVRLDLAEARTEVDEVLLAEVLAANDDDDVIDECFIDFTKGFVVHVFYVNALDFGADLG